jgi:hypothetical protein
MALNFPADPTDGQVYESFTYDATKEVWKKTVASITLNAISDVNVPSPNDEDILVYSSDNQIWYSESLSNAVPGRISASSTTPSSPSAGDGWLDPSTGKFYVYITDEDSSQWVEV